MYTDNLPVSHPGASKSVNDITTQIDPFRGRMERGLPGYVRQPRHNVAIQKVCGLYVVLGDPAAEEGGPILCHVCATSSG